jgi:TIR domain
MAGGKVFINYRRDDSRADSGRLYDRLAARYPNRVFRDVGSLEPGVEWHEAIERVLGSSHACLVVIGKNWLDIAAPGGGRRLDDPKDTVRQEIVTALRLGMRVFPVLVGGAQMPAENQLPADLQPLAGRNALEITEQDWDAGFEKLAEALDRIIGQPTGAKRRHNLPLVVAGTAVVTAIVVIGLIVPHPNPKPPVDGGPHDAASNMTGGDESRDSGSNSSPAPESGSRSSSEKKSRPAPQDDTTPDSDQPSPASASEAPPSRPAVTPSELAGSWRAVVTGQGQEMLEGVDLYPDRSFRATLNNVSGAVGKWQYDPAEDAIELSNATNILNGTKFSCKLKTAGESPAAFNGGCIDAVQMSWNVAMTRSGSLSEMTDAAYSVPKVDLSALTTAEREAFLQVLSASWCTCGCRMTILNCLRNDRACMVSPNLAQSQLARFLRLTHGF